MPQNATVIVRTQRIVVSQPSKSVAVVNAGPIGPYGAPAPGLPDHYVKKTGTTVASPITGQLIIAEDGDVVRMLSDVGISIEAWNAANTSQHGEISFNHLDTGVLALLNTTNAAETQFFNNTSAGVSNPVLALGTAETRFYNNDGSGVSNHVLSLVHNGASFKKAITVEPLPATGESFIARATSSSASERAGARFGDWVIGQDLWNNNDKNFFFWNDSIGPTFVINNSGLELYAVGGRYCRIYTNGTEHFTSDASSGVNMFTGYGDRALTLRPQAGSNSPYIDFLTSDMSARFGYMQISSAVADISHDNSSGYVRMLVGGQVKLFCSNDTVETNRRIQAHHSPSNGNWDHAHFVADAADGNTARVSFRSSTIAPQFRSYIGNGSAIEVLSEDSGLYRPLNASAFNVSSASDTKTHVVPATRKARGRLKNLAVKEYRRGHGPVNVRDKEDGTLETVIHGETCGESICDGTDESPCADVRNSQFSKTGLMAEDVARHFPGVAYYNTDGKPIGWDVPQMVAIVKQGTDELEEEVDLLKEELAAEKAARLLLEQRLTILEGAL